MNPSERGHKFSPRLIPAKPGVYIYRNPFGDVIYVGKASNLRKRMSHYFQPSKRDIADPKLRSLIHSIHSWEYIVVKNEDESLLLESQLIKKYSPRYNVLLRDDKRFWLIKIDTTAPYPYLQLARLHKDDRATYFGPFPKGGALKPTVEFLSRYFGLRTCKSTYPNERDHKHCLASVVKDCCAPCIHNVTQEEYHERVQQMLAVLNGDIHPILDVLKEKMETAAAQKRFEQAARWRDLSTNITEVLSKKNRTFKNITLPSRDTQAGVTELKNTLQLEKYPNHIECFDISNISGELAVASMVVFKNGKPSKKDYRRFRIKDVHQIDDFAMMQEVVRRHYQRKIDEKTAMPSLIVVDGGKGQLSSTVAILNELNLTIPIIGLAKRLEEVFKPNDSEPIILNERSPALYLLQSLRDEAHRFAITYHRELRLKRIQDSLLDDIEGIGRVRKKALLQRFGSIRELRKATPEEITQKVPGIGLIMAKQIVAHLKRK